MRIRSPGCSGCGPRSGSSFRYVPFVEPEILQHDDVPVRREPRVLRGRERVLQLDVRLLPPPEHGAVGKRVGGTGAQPRRGLHAQLRLAARSPSPPRPAEATCMPVASSA